MGYYQAARDAFRRGDTDTVARLSRRELTRARADGDVASEVEALGMLARVAIRGDDLVEAERCATQAMTMAKGTGDKQLERTPTHILAGLARLSGDLEGARVLLKKSIALNKWLDMPDTVSVDTRNLAYVELHLGQLDRARELFTSARQQTHALGDDEDMLPYLAVDAAVLACADGDYPRAARLLGGAQSALRIMEQVPDPDDAIEATTLRDRLVDALGQPEFDTRYAEGIGLDLREALAG